MIFAVLAVLALVMVVVATIGFRIRQQSALAGNWAFAMMSGGIVWWVAAMVVGHVADQFFELHVTFVFLTRIEWIGVFATIVGWFLFALEYTGRSEFATRRIAGLLLLFPILVYPIAFANGLIVDAVAPLVGFSTNLTATFDPWLSVEPLILAYLYSLLAASSLLLLVFFFQRRLPQPEVAILWLLALVVPWALNFLYMADIIEPLTAARIDPTPFGFVGLAAIGFLAIKRSEIIARSPLARAYVVDNLDVGILVFDSERRIVDANARARALLGLGRDDVGSDVAAALEAAGSSSPPFEPSDSTVDSFVQSIDGETIRFETGDGSKQIGIEITPIRDDRDGVGPGVGYYGLVLRDETERIERQRTLERQTEQLEVLNQVVRHDIRNDMQVIDGYGSILEDHVDAEGREYLHPINRKTEYVIQLTRTVRDLTEAVLAENDDLEPVPLRPVLTEEIAALRDSHDGASIELTGAREVSVLANQMLGSVFRNLIQNAILHSEGVPRVVIAVEERESTVRVLVADDGPGISEEDRERIFDRGERGNGSGGSGLGLYLVETLVSRYGGEVGVETENGGSIATDSGHELASMEGATFTVELRKPSGKTD